MRLVDVTVSQQSVFGHTRQETQTATQYDTVAEAVQDLGDARLLQLLNAKILSVTKVRLRTLLGRMSARTTPRLGRI